MARAKKDPETGRYVLPPDSHDIVSRLVTADNEMVKDPNYKEGKYDPLVRVLGPEHPGRTRAISNVIGPTQLQQGMSRCGQTRDASGDCVDENHDRASEEQVDTISREDFCGTGVSGGPIIAHPLIEKVTPCQLLDPAHLSEEKVVATGQIWPTSERTLHGILIHERCAKVQVEEIVSGCEGDDVPDVTKTDEISCLEDMLFSFIQWPRNAIKVGKTKAPNKSLGASRNGPSLGSFRHSGASPSKQSGKVASSSCYRPQPQEDDPRYLQGPYLRSSAPSSFLNMLLDEMPEELCHHDMTKSYDLNPEATKKVASSHSFDSGAPFVDPAVSEALESIQKWPEEYKYMVGLLATCVGQNHFIRFSSPTGMYSKRVDDVIPYSELLQLFIKGWLDITVIHWFAMDCFESRNSGSAFFNPKSITGDLCIRKRRDVLDHIRGIYKLHRDKNFFVAPYLANRHWTLIIIDPSSARGYIMDSMMEYNDVHSYAITSLVHEAFGFTFHWQMVQCKQQLKDWECGYIVIKHMYDFVNSTQHDLQNRLGDVDGFFAHSEIEKLVLQIVPRFISKAFPEGQELLRVANIAT